MRISHIGRQFSHNRKAKPTAEASVLPQITQHNANVLVQGGNKQEDHPHAPKSITHLVLFGGLTHESAESARICQNLHHLDMDSYLPTRICTRCIRIHEKICTKHTRIHTRICQNLPESVRICREVYVLFHPKTTKLQTTPPEAPYAFQRLIRHSELANNARHGCRRDGGEIPKPRAMQLHPNSSDGGAKMRTSGNVHDKSYDNLQKPSSSLRSERSCRSKPSRLQPRLLEGGQRLQDCDGPSNMAITTFDSPHRFY